MMEDDCNVEAAFSEMYAELYDLNDLVQASVKRLDALELILKGILAGIKLSGD